MKWRDLHCQRAPKYLLIISFQSPPPEGSSASSTVSCPEGGSADDEGSREGEEDDEREGRDLTVGVVQNFLNSDQITTPRTRKRVESFKQGLAARRIQRTWKHFYEEVVLLHLFLVSWTTLT